MCIRDSVDIGGVDGMVHVSELSWNRIKTPADVVKVGDEIDVYVIALDPEKKKISLNDDFVDTYITAVTEQEDAMPITF